MLHCLYIYCPINTAHKFSYSLFITDEHWTASSSWDSHSNRANWMPMRINSLHCFYLNFTSDLELTHIPKGVPHSTLAAYCHCLSMNCLSHSTVISAQLCIQVRENAVIYICLTISPNTVYPSRTVPLSSFTLLGQVASPASPIGIHDSLYPSHYFLQYCGFCRETFP